MVKSIFASQVYALTLLRLSEEEEEESEEEEEEEEEEAAETQPDGLQTPSGLETPSGMASVVSTVAGGLETPDFLELRKNASRVTDVGDSRSLYQVVPERQSSVRGLMGSDRAYDIGGVAGSAQNLPVLGEERGTKVSFLKKRKCSIGLIRYAPYPQRKADGVEVSIDASELENMTEDELRRKYDAQSRGSAGVPGSREDFSDMVASEMAKKKQKMERRREAKEKEFKF
jgi:splicing factor 3B subunit 2